MAGVSNRQAFETLVVPHLDAAYNLARWLLRSDQAERDRLEASLRAFFDIHIDLEMHMR